MQQTQNKLNWSLKNLGLTLMNIKKIILQIKPQFVL